MKLADAPIGLRVAMVEAMDQETRWTHYARREGVARFNTNPSKPTAFVPAHRLRTVQGMAGQVPRYDSGEYCVETEVDGRIEVIDASLIPQGVVTPVPRIVLARRLPLLMAAFGSDEPSLMRAIDHVLVTAALMGIKPAHDFTIGAEFHTHGTNAAGAKRRWRITDIGSRTAAAICLNDDPRFDDDPTWHCGPPYAVVEHVFDLEELIYWDDENNDQVSDEQEHS